MPLLISDVENQEQQGSAAGVALQEWCCRVVVGALIESTGSSS